MSRRLYLTPLPERAQRQARAGVGQDLSAQGLLNSDTAAVRSIAIDPSDQRLRGQLRGAYAAALAAEVRELPHSTAPLPLLTDANTSAPDPRDAWVEVADASVEPLRPQTDRLWQYEVSLTQAGTPASHQRGTAVAAATSIDSPWATGSDTYIAVPADAERKRWLNEQTGESTLLDGFFEEHATAYGGPVWFVKPGVAGSPGETATATWFEPFPDDGALAVRLYDDWGRPRTDSAGVLQWQHVFATDHVFRGVPVIDTGRLRLWLGAPTGSAPAPVGGIAAEQYQDGSWSAAGLADTGATLTDVALSHIGPERVTVTLTVDKSYNTYHVRGDIMRGRQGVLWRPIDGSLPSGIVDWLAPIAIPDPGFRQPTATLIDRTRL